MGQVWEWTHSKGVYTVKSGYRLGRSLSSDPGCSGEGGGSSSITSFWKGLWKSSIPAKIKLFVWRACSNFLPTNECLAHRKVPVNPRCPLCKCKYENTLHALWGCKLLLSTRQRWNFVKTNWYGGKTFFFEFLLDCSYYLKEEEMDLLFVMMWKTWASRNVVVHRVPYDAAVDNFDWVVLYLKNFSVDVPILILDTGQRYEQSRVWKPPDQGFYKINCDAAIDCGSCLVGCGAVIRNENGLVMAASSQRLVANFPTHIAEASAILSGIQLAIDSGLVQVMVESDAAVVVDWINDESGLLSEVGIVIADIKNLLQHIRCSSVSFVPKLANQVAHCLAKLALSCCEDRFWLEDYPPSVRMLVLAEARSCF